MKSVAIYKDRIKKSIDKIPGSKLKEALYFIEFLGDKKEIPLSVTNEKRLILNSAGLWRGEIEGIEYENILRSRWAERFKAD